MLRFVFLAVAAISILQAHDPITTSLTWSQEISRIVYKRCIGCHSVGGNAPMPLTTYEEVRPWAKAIKEEVLQRRMPPWGAVKGFGDFRDDVSLTQDELMRIAQWVEGGAPEGDPVYIPAMPRRSSKPALRRGQRVRKLVGPVKLLGIRPLNSIASVQLVANLPNGSTIPLLWLHEYKQSWNRTFVYREPVVLPRGTTVTAYPKYPFEFLVDSGNQSGR